MFQNGLKEQKMVYHIVETSRIGSGKKNSEGSANPMKGLKKIMINIPDSIVWNIL